MRNNNQGSRNLSLNINASDQLTNFKNKQPSRPSAFRPQSPSNSSGKHVLFTSNIGSVTSDIAFQEPQLQQILFRNQSKGLSVQDIQSTSGVNVGWPNLAFNRMLCQRIARQLISLKQAIQFLRNMLIDQQKDFNQLRKAISIQITGKIQNYLKQSKDKGSNQTFNFSGLEVQYKAKIKQNQVLVEQIQGMKKLIQKIQMNKQQDSSCKEGGFCNNCKLLQIKLTSARQQTVSINRQFHKIQSDNQKLQQTIFDLEQQVIGIDLEVQKRLKKVLLQMPQFTKQTKNQQPNRQFLENMKESLDRAQTRCRHYQSLCKSQEELHQREEELSIRQKEYQLKNQALLEAINRAQETNNKNYQKEHQLLLAEQQYYQKLQAIRSKQAELSQWQKSLAHQNISNQLGVSFSKGISQSQEQISMKNLAVNDCNDAEDQYYKDYQGNNHKNQMMRSGDNFVIPKLPLNQHGVDSRVSQNRPSSQYQHYSRYSNKVQYTNHRVNTQQNNSRVSHPYRPSASNKHLGIKHHNKYEVSHSRSKDIMSRHSGRRDRSSSPSHSFKNSHYKNHNRGNPTYGGSYSKAEDKLEKLKQELKRELESIK